MVKGTRTDPAAQSSPSHVSSPSPGLAPYRLPRISLLCAHLALNHDVYIALAVMFSAAIHGEISSHWTVRRYVAWIASGCSFGHFAASKSTGKLGDQAQNSLGRKGSRKNPETINTSRTIDIICSHDLLV